jgi:toxin ParE1/3/4
MSRSVKWSFDAKADLVEIISYIKEAAGPKTAKQVYDRIKEKISKCGDYPEGYRLVPELQEIGVLEYREIIETPWRIFFRVAGDEIRIISVIDGRRNVEDILYKKVMEGKLKS